MMAKAPIRKPRKKVCLFCQEKISYVDYKDTGLLRKFISDRGKIRARRVTGNCTQHQRDVAKAIKNAREMALIGNELAQQPGVLVVHVGDLLLAEQADFLPGLADRC